MEIQEGQQQPQARPQPEVAANTASTADLLPAATPSATALPSPTVPGAAPGPGDSAEELPAHAAPTLPPSPVEQHSQHHHKHHQPSSVPPQAAGSGKEDTGELHEQGAQASPQTISRTTSQTAATADSSAETRPVRGGSTQPHSPSRGQAGLTSDFVPRTGPGPGSELEAVLESRSEPREEHKPQAVDAEARIAVTAHEQAREEQQLQPLRDSTARQSDLTTTNDSSLPTTTSTTLPSILSSLATNPAVTATSTVTNGTETNGQTNGHVSTSASPSPAPGQMSNIPPQLSGSPRPPPQQQQAPPINYVPQPTYPTATTTGLNTQYGYTGTGAQPHDAYRAGANVTNSTTSLPSMRTFDRVQHQQQQHAHTPIAMPHAMASSVVGNVGYYQQQSAPLTSNNAYGLAPDMMGAHRYPLPPNDPRGILAGTRHKKVGQYHRASIHVPLSRI